MKKKNKILLILNIIIIILEIIGLITTIKMTGKLELKYYTECSNIIMLVASSIYVYYLLSKKDIPKWLEILYHMGVLGLSITFLVVIFILAPMYNFIYEWLLFDGGMLYFHTLCPIFAFITYIFFTNTHIEKHELPYTMMFTIVYSVVLIICNICHLTEGPYPFLKVYKQPIYMSILWVVLIDGGAYLLSKAIYKIKRQVMNHD